MVDQIKKQLEGINTKYPAIAHQCLKYIENNSNIDNNNTIKIFHRPWLAPQNWGIKLFEPIRISWNKDFQERTNRVIPDFYEDFLKTTNGGFIYDLSLYGLPPSLYNSGLLSRALLQCHDLTSANNSWIINYEIEREHFHFGGRAYTFDENVGYFYRKDEIISIRQNGETINKWYDFNGFLKDEIEKAEEMMKEEILDNTNIIIK
ncbi:hypothetical protein AAE02nite_06140 [Adhaeribacter aerolatus]|uniref:Uncharacterized protein n=1 Tax=Adhaeribacter aerolatus TaxID=670289 RepID=A0A512ATE0_9BACT|nr:hypothetical protein [Adhaeribacter aerolatus]GEO02950.1 hypothetical protein AAE02nite_06140 [Adhaeribacter aerolatus]